MLVSGNHRSHKKQEHMETWDAEVQIDLLGEKSPGNLSIAGYFQIGKPTEHGWRRSEGRRSST